VARSSCPVRLPRNCLSSNATRAGGRRAFRSRRVLVDDHCRPSARLGEACHRGSRKQAPVDSGEQATILAGVVKLCHKL
jgi:hypothetical protein